MPIRKVMITKVFSWIGHKIARPRGVDWRVYARQGRVVDFTMLFFLIAVVGLGFYSPVVNFFKESFSAAPDVVVPRGDWKVVYEGGAFCGVGVPGAKDSCFAERESPLWKSKRTLGDKDFMARAREVQGQRFWAGVHFASGSAVLREASAADAYQLVIGHINAPFRIYVNGAKRFEGDGKDFLPVSVSLSRADVVRAGRGDAGGVRVAIEVTHTLGSAFPLAVGLPYATGLFSDLKAKDFRNLWITTMIARPLAFGLTGLIVFSVFFFLWMSVRDRSEYLAYALFALCLFAIQLMHWGVIKHSLDRGDWYFIDLALRFSEGVFAGALGFTYARVRRELVFFAIASGLFAFGICHYVAVLGSDFLSLSAFLAKYYVPVLYTVGAFSCFAAGETCDEESKRKGGDRRLDIRTVRLYTFGSLLFLLGAMYFNDAFKIFNFSNGLAAAWYRPFQLGIVALIGVFIFRDYREFDFVMETSVQSRFHNPHLKEQRIFQGAMLHLDLKGSSALYDYSAEHGLATKLPTRWCEGVTQVIKTFGGEHLSSGGDSVFAFFPGEGLASSERAFLAMQEIEKFTQEFGKEISAQVNYRGAVLCGAIRPIYKTLSGKRFEDYEDAPGETLFKDASRVLEAEKSLGVKGESVLVVDESLRFVAGKYFASLKNEKVSVRDVGTRDLYFYSVTKLREKKSVA